MDWESTASPCYSMDYEASVTKQTDVLMYCQTLQCVSSGILIISIYSVFLQLIGWDWPPQGLSSSPLFYWGFFLVGLKKQKEKAEFIVGFCGVCLAVVFLFFCDFWSVPQYSVWCRAWDCSAYSSRVHILL